MCSSDLDLALRKSASFRELEESVDKVNGVTRPEAKVETKPVEPATTDLTAKPVSMKATVGETSAITKGIDETPVKVN